MHIKNTGYNVYYIVNDKTSLQSVNILFNEELNIQKETEKHVNVDGVDLEMQLTHNYEYFVLKADDLYFIFNIGRISANDNTGTISDILNNNQLFSNFESVLEEHFLKTGTVIIEEIKKYLEVYKISM